MEYCSEIEQKAKAAKARYQREWRKKNPGKTSEYLKRYWLKRAEKELNRGQEGQNGR